MSDPTKSDGWLYQPRVLNGIFWGLGGFCALLLVADVFVPKEHAHFAWEHWFGAYGWIGALASVLIVYSAVVGRRLLYRPEDYYGD